MLEIQEKLVKRTQILMQKNILFNSSCYEI
jgi:hypothetical protein